VSWLEATAVALALVYLALAIRQHVACWAFGAASSALYFVVFWQATLYLEALLQLLYIGLSAYGFWLWRARREQPLRPIERWPIEVHLAGAIVVLAATGFFGWLMHHYTDAAHPWFDALLALASVLTTVMVARKVLENWLYWIAINFAGVALYWQRDLQLTAGLFVVYGVFAVVGFVTWRRAWLTQSR
jgi:nicotinamide mononucleotide transporter